MIRCTKCGKESFEDGLISILHMGAVDEKAEFVKYSIKSRSAFCWSLTRYLVFRYSPQVSFRCFMDYSKKSK